MLDKYFWIESGAQFEDNSGRKGISITPPYEDISGKNVFVGRYIDEGLARVITCASVIPLEVSIVLERQDALALQKEIDTVISPQSELTQLKYLKTILDTMLCKPRS